MDVIKHMAHEVRKEKEKERAVGGGMLTDTVENSGHARPSWTEGYKDYPPKQCPPTHKGFTTPDPLKAPLYYSLLLRPGYRWQRGGEVRGWRGWRLCGHRSYDPHPLFPAPPHLLYTRDAWRRHQSREVYSYLCGGKVEINLVKISLISLELVLNLDLPVISILAYYGSNNLDHAAAEAESSGNEPESLDSLAARSSLALNGTAAFVSIDRISPLRSVSLYGLKPCFGSARALLAR
uniref:Uncharacterized protein n=1 Tax=Timema douglasi TaxID=61478 RepID=A0A7R8VU96_TIMDO|nr:unnamed protein product [Timema douglasi]